MKILQLLLPVLWSVISTIVGLVLYRTTTAKVQTKGVALAGSTFIAAACFIGLDQVTPANVFKGPDDAVVDRLSRLTNESTAHAQTAIHVCIDEARNELQCATELDTLRSTLKEIATETAKLHPSN